MIKLLFENSTTMCTLQMLVIGVLVLLAETQGRSVELYQVCSRISVVCLIKWEFNSNILQCVVIGGMNVLQTQQCQLYLGTAQSNLHIYLHTYF